MSEHARRLWVAATVSAALMAHPAAGAAQPAEATAAQRRAQQVLEDVCDAIACVENELKSGEHALERVAALKKTPAPGPLAAVYAALGARRDPGRPLAPDALKLVGEILAADCAPASAGALTLGLPQTDKRHPHPYLLERSFLLPFQKGLILEAQVAPHLYFYQNLTKEQGVSLHGGNAAGISVTPMFKVRIRNETSAPVQTLSFMPKLNLQYFRLPRKKATDAWSDTVWMKGGLFVWGHHSNGQTECLYQGSTDDECTAPPALADVRINYPNGSFSTNYLKLSLFGSRIRLGADNLTPDGQFIQRLAQSKTTFAVSLEVNPPALPPGGSLEEPARSLYGPTRVSAVVAHERRLKGSGFVSGSWGATGTIEYFNKASGVGSSNWRFTAEGAWEPDWFRSGGFMVRYVHGQDYYNLQFDRDIHWLQFGIVFSASEFEPFLQRK